MIREAPAKVSPPKDEPEPKRVRQDLLFICLLAQLLLIVCTSILGVWLRMPQLCLFLTLLSGVAAMMGGFAEAKGRTIHVKWAKGTVAANLLLTPVAFLFPKAQVATLDSLYAVAAWMVAAAIFVPTLLAKKFRENPSEQSQSNTERALNPRWRQLALVWGAFGATIWLAVSYSRNQPVAFHVGLIITIGLSLLAKFWFRLPTIFTQIINTFILLSIGLPLVDVFLRPSN